MPASKKPSAKVCAAASKKVAKCQRENDHSAACRRAESTLARCNRLGLKDHKGKSMGTGVKFTKQSISKPRGGGGDRPGRKTGGGGGGGRGSRLPRAAAPTFGGGIRGIQAATPWPLSSSNFDGKDKTQTATGYKQGDIGGAVLDEKGSDLVTKGRGPTRIDHKGHLRGAEFGLQRDSKLRGRAVPPGSVFAADDAGELFISHPNPDAFNDFLTQEDLEHEEDATQYHRHRGTKEPWSNPRRADTTTEAARQGGLSSTADAQSKEKQSMKRGLGRFRGAMEQSLLHGDPALYAKQAYDATGAAYDWAQQNPVRAGTVGAAAAMPNAAIEVLKTGGKATLAGMSAAGKAAEFIDDYARGEADWNPVYEGVGNVTEKFTDLVNSASDMAMEKIYELGQQGAGMALEKFDDTVMDPTTAALMMTMSGANLYNPRVPNLGVPHLATAYIATKGAEKLYGAASDASANAYDAGVNAIGALGEAVGNYFESPAGLVNEAPAPPPMVPDVPVSEQPLSSLDDPEVSFNWEGAPYARYGRNLSLDDEVFDLDKPEYDVRDVVDDEMFPGPPQQELAVPQEMGMEVVPYTGDTVSEILPDDPQYAPTVSDDWTKSYLPQIGAFAATAAYGAVHADQAGLGNTILPMWPN